MSVLPRLAVLSLVALATGCGEPKSQFDARDEQLFALPAWCGKTGPRRPWTAWAEDRARDPTTRGTCGVRLPEATDAEAGVCVEIDGDDVRGVVRENDRAEKLDDFASRALRDAWVAVPRDKDLVLVRLEHGSLRAKTRDGSESVEGPCFFR